MVSKKNCFEKQNDVTVEFAMQMKPFDRWIEIETSNGNEKKVNQ